MTERLYPKPPRPEKDRTHLRWRVDYCLAYDGGHGEWSGYYRTRTRARIAAWWNFHIASWGGSAKLIDQTGGIR